MLSYQPSLTTTWPLQWSGSMACPLCAPPTAFLPTFLNYFSRTPPTYIFPSFKIVLPNNSLCVANLNWMFWSLLLHQLPWVLWLINLVINSLFITYIHIVQFFPSCLFKTMIYTEMLFIVKPFRQLVEKSVHYANCKYCSTTLYYISAVSSFSVFWQIFKFSIISLFMSITINFALSF